MLQTVHQVVFVYENRNGIFTWPCTKSISSKTPRNTHQV